MPSPPLLFSVSASPHHSPGLVPVSLSLFLPIPRWRPGGSAQARYGRRAKGAGPQRKQPRPSLLKDAARELGSNPARVRARPATRTLGGRRWGAGLVLQKEEPSALSDNWWWKGLQRMRSPRLSAEPELVARGSFEGARVEGNKKP